MTEQKQQTNHSEIKEISRFASHLVRLTWIILLSLLLTAGLCFQAPWKVTALVLIFLLAATILPRAYRKWFRVGVGCVAVAVVIWVFLPEGNKVWRPYTFDKEFAALQAKYAIPDEENAAIIYNELLENYDSNSFYDSSPNGDQLPMREPWLSKEHPKISKWLERHKATINTLLNASKIERCRFPINAEIASLSRMMYRLTSMKRWAYLLISVANNDVAEGRTKDGLDKYIAALQMGGHQRQQSSIIDFLEGVVIEGLSFKQLNRFVATGNATEEHLNLAEQAMSRIKYDWGTDLPRILDYEKLLTKNFWGAFYEVGPEGEVRLGCAATAGNKVQRAGQIPVPVYWQKKLDKLKNILYWFYMPSTPERAGAIVDEVYEKCYAMAALDYNWQKKPREFSTNPVRFNCRYMIGMQLYILEPFYRSAYHTYLRTLALQRGSRLIVALRRYKNKNGNWPQSLDDIAPITPEEIFVDPINGSSFVYKLTNGGFTLYSRGKNGIDDGGLQDEETDADDQLIWSGESY